jgi:thioredoxin 1
MIEPVTDATFGSEVVASSDPVLVEFGASWCPPCRAMAPVLEDVARELRGRARVVSVDRDENPAVSGRLGVLSIPTLILFAGGAPVRRIVGYTSKPRLLRLVEEALGETAPAR